DNHCLAVYKPAGRVSAHFQGEEATLDMEVKAYLKEKYRKPGNVFLGVVHRLDRPVSGVLLFARTSKSAARLSQQFREGAVEKVYWAVISSAEPGTQNAERMASSALSTPRSALPDVGTFEDWLAKDAPNRIIETVSRDSPEAQHALTHYHVRSRHAELTLLELRPQTGRKHQLRVQLSSRGHPIYGDAKYGSPHTFGHAIALHARSLTFLHPTKHEPITLTAEVPKQWLGRFAHLLKPEGGQ